jgi:hypothetical protein
MHIPNACANDLYGLRRGDTRNQFKAGEITKTAFGDLFLEAVKRYWDGRTAEIGMTGLYPIACKAGRSAMRIARCNGCDNVTACQAPQRRAPAA